MLSAIIAIIVTLVILVAIVLIVFAVRNRKGPSKVKSGKHSVQSISSVGVSSKADNYRKPGNRSAPIRVNEPASSASNMMDSLKSRFVAMGVFAAAVFGALGIRLWNMQILDSEEYLEQAELNTYTTVSTTAPRGLIYDAAGVPLVKNRSSLTVLANAEVANDRDVVQRLSVLLGIPHNIVRQRIMDTSSGAQSQRIVASDVGLRNVAFISEHASAFPGVSTESRTVREYPYGALAAHVLGYTGLMSEEELQTQKEGVVYEMGDTIGKTGVEASYDSILAGDHGQRVVVADADGTVRQVVSETEPTKGNDIYLTIKAQVQQVADRALAAMVAPEGVIGKGKGTAASLVCLDVTDGGVVALSNYPTYTPESFIGGISQEVWDLFNTTESHYPLLNRAIAGTYPAASTFKAFTGLAGLEFGFADDKREWDCQGTWTGFGANDPQSCWDLSGHGHLGFRTGVVVSCDTVFYEIAKSFYDARDTVGNTAMQDFIKRYGFGKQTGIDLSGEEAGRIPTPEWKQDYFKDVPEEASWKPGDLSNMSIGQGYVLVTPMQMAIGYAAVATGKIPKPHLLKEVRNSENQKVVEFKPEILSTPEVTPEHLNIMRDSLKGVADEDTLVSRAFYQNGISSAAAKTGTAEVAGKQDFGWFACYAPYDNPKYVVACVVEEGSAGAQSACPLCAEVLSAALRYDEGSLDMSLSPIAGSSGESVELDYGNTSSGRTD
ncbi:MAG: penicillin-binding protein 2 [Raoultibacter sp.]